jgi:hypothetical protein
MDRPIEPDPAECPKIRKAMRVARFMKWGAPFLTGIIALVAILVGVMLAWFWGVAVFAISWVALLVVGYSLARCPRCGQVWWSVLAVFGLSAVIESAARGTQEDETESFVCRRCRLDIGLGLKG